MHGRNDPETIRLPLPTDTDTHDACIASLSLLCGVSWCRFSGDSDSDSGVHGHMDSDDGVSVDSGVHGHMDSDVSPEMCSCSVVLSIDIIYIFS